MSGDAEDAIARGLGAIRGLAGARSMDAPERTELAASIEELRAAIRRVPSRSNAVLLDRTERLLDAIDAWPGTEPGVPPELAAIARSCMIPIGLPSRRTRARPRTDVPLRPARVMAVGGRGTFDAYPGDVTDALTAALEDLLNECGALVAFAIDRTGTLHAAAGDASVHDTTRYTRLIAGSWTERLRREHRVTFVDGEGHGVCCLLVGALVVTVLFDRPGGVSNVAANRAIEAISRVLEGMPEVTLFSADELAELFGAEEPDLR